MIDPDKFVQWFREEEPGENPRWVSQCGLIEQISFGDSPRFVGFVGSLKTPQEPKSILAGVKRDVEQAYTRSNSLSWNYTDVNVMLDARWAQTGHS